MAPQRRWKIHQQHQALLEFSDISAHCPPGVYLAHHPSKPCQWSGVYFVRKGSYATAPLRFRVTIPARYPEAAPVLIFSNDIFHPLVCPLTTYTYSTASPARQPVSSSDSQRLSPGSLNLQHQFPIWFEGSRGQKEVEEGVSPSPLSAEPPSREDPAFSDDEFNQLSPSNRLTTTHGAKLPFMPPPKPDALHWSEAERYPSISEVLEYMVRVFEDEELLDSVPLDAAAHSSAHHAYTAWRKRVKEAEAAKEAAKARTAEGPPATPQHRFARSHMPTASPGRSPAAWNWDGVWQERVRKSVKSATADGTLYKDDEGDEHQLITFLDREKDEIKFMKAAALKAGKSMTPRLT